MSRAPFVHVSLLHGLAPGWMAQAARVILALAAEGRVVMPWDVRDAAWPLLLDLDAQYRLAMLSDDALREEALQALRNSPGAERHVAFTKVGHVHAGVHENAWLWLLGGAPHAHEVLRTTRRQVALGTGTEAVFSGGPQSDGGWPAPHLLADLWFEPGEPLGTGTLCIVDDGPVPEGLAVLAKQRREYPGPWTLFDPWDRWTTPAVRAQLPEGVQAVGPTHDALRRSTFAR
jgi:hypothetical protein